MEDLDKKIIELMDLFDDEQVTTADKIDRPERAIEKQAIDDFMKRNPMAGGGMLVQPSVDGSRPGYNGANKTSNFTVEQQKNIKAWEDATGKKFSDLLKLKGRSAASKRSEIKRGKTKGTGIYTKGGEKLSLPKNMQSLYNQIKDEKYGGKKFSELSGSQRSNFKNNFETTQAAYNRTKNAITLEELQKLLTNEFGQDISKNKIRGRFGKTGITDFAKEIEKLKVGTGLGGAEVYYKKPSKLDLKNISQYLEFAGKNRLNKSTVDTMLKLHEKFNYLYRQNALPSMEDVIASDPFFKNLSHNRIGNATARLSQIYSGHKFKNPELNDIRINKKAGEKMFDLMSKARFGNPYYAGFYRTALQTIDEKLGNKKGTFESLKKEAVKILKKNKIPVYNINAKNPVGFNINEIAGVAGSSKSKAAEFSQFVDIMEGSLNQQEMASFQSELSRARKAIEDDPSKLSVESKKINSRAKSLEKTYNVELPRLRDPDATKYFSPTRIRELNAQGIDIVKAAERAGYTIQMPKSAVTIEEFVKQTPKAVRGLSAFMKTNFPELKCSLSKGVNCNDPQAYQRAVNEYSQKAAQGDEAAKATLSKFSNKVATAGKFIKGALGPLALATEVAIDLAIPLNQTLQEGVPYKQAFADSLINKYILGPKLQVDKEAEIAKEMAKGEEFAMAKRGERMFLPQSATADAQRLKKREEEMKALYPQLDMVNLPNKQIDELLAAQGVYSPFTLGFGMQQRQPGIGDMRYNEDVAYDEIRDIFNKGAEEDIRRQQMENLMGGAANFEKGGRAGFKFGTRKGILKLIDESVKKTPKDITPELDKLIKKTLDEDFFDKKDRIVDTLNVKAARERKNFPYNQQVQEEPSQLNFYDDIVQSNFRTKTGPFFDYQKRKNKAGGGILKQAGDSSGPPPESGPNPQGLQGLMKRGMKI
jgi:hypothetical protein